MSDWYYTSERTGLRYLKLSEEEKKKYFSLTHPPFYLAVFFFAAFLINIGNLPAIASVATIGITLFAVAVGLVQRGHYKQQLQLKKIETLYDRDEVINLLNQFAAKNNWKKIGAENINLIEFMTPQYFAAAEKIVRIFFDENSNEIYVHSISIVYRPDSINDENCRNISQLLSPPKEASN